MVATVYAMPNLFGDDPAVQISAGRTATVDLDLVNQAETTLKDAGIDYKGVELEAEKLLIRLNSPGEQLRAKDLLSTSLPEDYIVALNLAPTTPNWLASLGAEPMNLGLDLRGGVHFLMEVDMDAAVKQALESYASDIRLSLRDEKIRYKQIKTDMQQLVVVFRNSDDRDAAERLISNEMSALQIESGEDNGAPALVMQLTEVDLR
jgi:preprotein translocase subunit SecD